jgi:hypothetical protein
MPLRQRQANEEEMMQQLLSPASLQEILEKGLVGGLWSIQQFNRTSKPGEPVLPTPGFLTDHPEFYDKGFRDLRAFDEGAGQRAWLP